MFVLSNWTKRFLKNLFGVMVIVGMCGFFLEAALETPTMEINYKNERCLRVVDGKGGAIPNGCKDARNGKLVTEHRFVGK